MRTIFFNDSFLYVWCTYVVHLYKYEQKKNCSKCTMLHIANIAEFRQNQVGYTHFEKFNERHWLTIVWLVLNAHLLSLRIDEWLGRGTRVTVYDKSKCVYGDINIIILKGWIIKGLTWRRKKTVLGINIKLYFGI